MTDSIKKTMKVLTVCAAARGEFDKLMMGIYNSGRVKTVDHPKLEAWSQNVYECTARMGEEFQQLFIKELKRQVLRQGGRAFDVGDAIITNTIATLVCQIDPIMQFQSHPALEALCKKITNCLAPCGNVVYRAHRFLVRRYNQSVTVQFTVAVCGGEAEEVLDKLDDVFEEEQYVG